MLGALAILVLVAPEAPLLAQADVRVYAGDVVEKRFAGGHEKGGLGLKVKVRGDGLEGAQALRLVLDEARDDLGSPLLQEAEGEPKFSGVRSPIVEEQIWLRSAAREATWFSVSGRVELFVPGRDQGSTVKVVNALSSPGKPLVSAGLDAAKLRLTVLSRTRPPENVVSLRGRKPDVDRIRSVQILRADGTEIRVASTGRMSYDEETTMSLEAAAPVPRDASLLFTILTPRSLVKVPFSLKEVPLP